MIIIKVFTVMSQLGIVIETSSPGRVSTVMHTDPSLLHVGYSPLEDVENPQDLYNKVTSALKHANGYAGDLLDHVED